MLMNQKASGITMESVGDCSIVINLKEHGVNIKTEGDNLSITIKKKADISQLWHNTNLDNLDNLDNINTMQASIATLEAHATYIDNIKNKKESVELPENNFKGDGKMTKTIIVKEGLTIKGGEIKIINTK